MSGAADEESPEGKRGDIALANIDPESAELESALRVKLGEIVPEPKRQEVTRVVAEIVASFHGPLPPPSVMRDYNDIVPSAAERIIAMAEKEQTHRHSWERGALNADRWYSMAGLIAGWTTALALAAGAVAAAAFGEPGVGIALAAASATGMVWKLIQGRSEKPEQQADEPSKPLAGNVSSERAEGNDKGSEISN